MSLSGFVNLRVAYLSGVLFNRIISGHTVGFDRSDIFGCADDKFFFDRQLQSSR